MERADSSRIAFYLERAKDSGGAALELGCGTALLSVALALEGIEVVAFDPSEDLVAQALERRRALDLPAERCRIERADLRSLRLRRQFGFAYAPANALLTLGGMEDLLAVFSTVQAHLSPEGLFAFDLRRQPSPAPAAEELTPLDWRAQQVRRPHLTLRTGRGEPATVHRLVLLGLSSAEIEGALGTSGLEVLERWGDFEGGQFTEQSELLVLVAGRKLPKAARRR